MDKNKIRQLADYAINECCDHSEDCYWTISYDELYYHFGAEVTDTNENGRLLEEELRQREEINELIMTEDCIEMTCHLQYCHNCQTDPVSLLSVLGCNIYDGHETERTAPPMRIRRRRCLCNKKFALYCSAAQDNLLLFERI